MSKVICDVCGTSYPESSTQCPICGCVRPADAPGVHNEGSVAAAGSYQHVKGGRFSKANVRKRNASAAATGTVARTGSKQPQKKKSQKSSANRGLVITIIILLLAILAVIGYIFVKFFMPTEKPADNAGNEAYATDEATDPPTDPVISCTGVTLDVNEITLNEVGQQYILSVVADPADTTDDISWSHADETVATVNGGIVTAVGFGETTVTVSCGEFTAECLVIVEEPFVLDMNEVVFEAAGAVDTIYSGMLDIDLITWTSDNEAVAVVADGVVTAVGPGNTTVYGEYKGSKLSCNVICDIEIPTEPEEDPFAPGPYRLDNLYSPYDDEAMVAVGESFTLALLDANGNTISDVTWTVEDSNCCTVSNGVVKALSSGVTTITASYNGQEFDFRLIVS